MSGMTHYILICLKLFDTHIFVQVMLTKEGILEDILANKCITTSDEAFFG